MFPPEEPLGTPLRNTLRLGDPNWTGGDLEGDLPGSYGSGEGPRAFGGEVNYVLGGGDGGQSRGDSEPGMAKEMDSILPIHHSQPILVVFQMEESVFSHPNHRGRSS